MASAIAGAVAGCGGETEAPDGPIGGSESHFLAYCDDTCGDGLACITGVCTRGCVVNEDACDDLSPNAVCTPESIEPGAVAVCDVSCEAHEDCSVISAEHTCEAGYCRKSADTGDGGTTNDGACDVEGTLVPSGTLVANPDGCGFCSCDAGLLTCDAGCPDVIEVRYCPEGELADDPLLVTAYHPEGDIFVVDVTHAGGCEEHTYSMCYRNHFMVSDPPVSTLHLMHDAHGDACEAGVSATLRFDVSQVLAEFGDGGFAFGLPRESEGGGLLSGGSVVFDVVQVFDSCRERASIANQQVESISEPRRACNDASECRYVPARGCTDICGTIVNELYVEEVTALVESIELSVCDGCSLPLICVGPDAVDCIDGVCVKGSP